MIRIDIESNEFGDPVLDSLFFFKDKFLVAYDTKREHPFRRDSDEVADCASHSGAMHCSSTLY